MVNQIAGFEITRLLAAKRQYLLVSGTHEVHDNSAIVIVLALTEIHQFLAAGEDRRISDESIGFDQWYWLSSAGGHFQTPGHTAEPASGDLTSLQVRKDGSGMMMTTTDAFGMDDLLTGEKTAIIIHAGADNFANIPPERYSQSNGTPGPDQTTMSTGDAGKRVACGVIGAG